MNLAEELSLASHAIDISASTQLGGEVLVEAPFKVFSNVALFTFRGGAFSYVSPASRLHRVQLGRYCSIGDDVRILSSHPTDGLTTSPFPYQRLFLSPFNARPQVRFSNLSDTVIGNDVWVGSGAPVGPVTVDAAPVGPVGPCAPVGPVTVDAAPVAPVGPVGPYVVVIASHALPFHDHVRAPNVYS